MKDKKPTQQPFGQPADRSKAKRTAMQTRSGGVTVVKNKKTEENKNVN